MWKMIALLMLLLAGCDGPGSNTDSGRRGYTPPTGWSYRPDLGVPLTFLNETREIELAGLCKGSPEYILFGGDYPSGAAEFALTTDDKTWTLPAWQGEHGRGLWVDRPEQTAAIANAKNRIVFQVGNWRREIRPGPELAAFAKACA